jgi:anti-sigma B factor antagonist
MPVRIVELNNGVTKVVLTGRIDIAGAQEIDLPMNVVGGSRKAVVIDLSGVEFMASMGLRSLIACANFIRRKGGKIVVTGPRPEVAEVINVMGVHELIPVYGTETGAILAVLPG